MLIPLFLAIGIPNYHRIYTIITFVGAALMLLVHYMIFNKKHLTFFFIMWIIHLIPLFIINGFLTGIPVVNYDDNENLGIRIGTVPLEDSFYSMFLLLINLSVYEGLLRFRKKKNG
jgi:lycopene cyclase domain-containing protein